MRLMNKFYIFILLLVTSFCLSADDFSRGATMGKELKVPLVAKMKPATVPNYEASTQNHYAGINEKNIKAKAQSAQKNNASVPLAQDSRVLIQESQKEKWTVNENVVDNAISPNAACKKLNCEPEPAIPSADFVQGVSSLQAVDAASKDMHQEGIWVFKHYVLFDGNKSSCKEASHGYNNCCREYGWGQDLHFAGCNQEEKKLAKDKENKLCHYIGRYCSNELKTPFGKTCLQHKKVYCCYSSQLGRIVIEGAHQQLHWAWGEAESPACGGLKPETLQKLDFEQIDFSEYEDDLNEQMSQPSSDEVVGHIKKEIKSS